MLWSRVTLHLQQNHYQLQAKGKLGKCWLLRSLRYIDITTRLLFKAIKIWFYHVKCYYTGITFRGSVCVYYGNTLGWELRGLDSGPYYPHDLEEVTYSGYASSSLICKWELLNKTRLSREGMPQLLREMACQGPPPQSFPEMYWTPHPPAPPCHNPFQCLSLISLPLPRMLMLLR